MQNKWGEILTRFFDMLAAMQAPLYNGCESYSELSVALEALSVLL